MQKYLPLHEESHSDTQGSLKVSRLDMKSALPE